MHIESVSKKEAIALITGASSGFGRETASLLAGHGFKVFGTSRKLGSSQMTNGFHMLQLDVCSDESVRDCIQNLIQQSGRLDILINNAGFSFNGAIEETTIEEAKAQFETNFFGAVRMVNAVLPIMRKQRSGQIINVGSLAGLIGVPFQAFYSASKHALEGYTESLRYEVKPFNIKVSIVEPGFFKTNIWNAKQFSSGSLDDYTRPRQHMLEFMTEHVQQGQDPKLVAEAILNIIENDSPKLRYKLGREKRLLWIRSILPQSMLESTARKYYKLDDDSQT